MSPAWMPPSSGSRDEIDRLGAEAPPEKRADRLVAARRRAGTTVPARAARARAADSRSYPRDAPQRQSEYRAPTARAARCRRPRFSTNAVRGGRGISLGEPERVAQLERRGLLRQDRNPGPASMVKPSACSVRISPPARASFEQAERHCRARQARYAGGSPVMPRADDDDHAAVHGYRVYAADHC